MKIEHVPGDGEKIVLGKLSKFLLVFILGIVATFFGFLYKDRVNFEHRLTLLEEISAKQTELINAKMMSHDKFVTKEEFLQMKEAVDRIETSVNRLEDTLVFEKAKK